MQIKNKVIPRKIFRIIFLIPVISIIYLLIPVIFSGNLQNISTFFKVIHTAFAITATACLIIAYLPADFFLYKNSSIEGSVKIRRIFSTLAFYLGFIHALLFIIKFTGMPKLELTILQNLSLYLGIIALLLISVPVIVRYLENLSYRLWSIFNKMGELALIFILCHLIFQKYAEWLSPGQWPLYLPPISIWICILIITAFIIKLIKVLFNKRKREEE